MKTIIRSLILLLAAASILGCRELTIRSTPNAIVGTWFVEDSGAPFHQHMYVFNADGTMQQANPDAGDPTASDSDGKGIWIAEGSRIRGKWMEITADRSTHKFVSRGEILFDIQVKGNTFAGTLSARFYDPNGKLQQDFPAAPIHGERLTLP
ncbi:hypothetical protein P8935_11660 [Telmatobacter sp. DSM 110680]|uniref:Lipocalin-like domain-containing protein n=1 Tax=Telmatobacter sp. DSM 110680 TaxID=3036704 RepID=A0AAU7DRM5_9BACT